MRAHRAMVALAAVAAVAAMATPEARSQQATDPEGAPSGPDGVVSAEFDAFAVRVQYDVPLPAGTGSLPHVVGEVRRSGAGENAKGLAAWPTHHDPVVGGTYADPDKSSKGDERNLPQVECFFPGQLLDTAFAYPTDTQAETAAAPPIGSATASCASGPVTELHVTGGPVDIPGLNLGAVAGDALARPVDNRIETATATRASGIILAGGALTVGSVEAGGSSATTGAPGGAVTEAHVTLTDVAAGPVTFSMADDRLIIAGQEIPIASDEGRGVLDAANAALAPSGCSLTAIGAPDAFPQGFLFSREDPFIGVRPDGTGAGSMRAGLQVVCDVPRGVSEPTGFNPQRMQVVLGFAFSGVAATAEPGGFGLGNLLDAVDVGGNDVTADGDLGFGVLAPDGLGAVRPPAPAAPATAPETGDRGEGAASTETALVPASALPGGMESGARFALLALCAMGWAALTHVGLRKLRGVTAP